VWTNCKNSRASPAPVVQGIEHRFPNPKIYVASARKLWGIPSSAGFSWVLAQRHCEKVEQDWSKRGSNSIRLPLVEFSR
jgi:hypothetical protein